MTVQGAAVPEAATRDTSTEQRGSWPTALAVVASLLPLAVGVGLAVAIVRGVAVGPLSGPQVVWYVIVPLGLIYAPFAAFSRVHAYAPTTVLVMAAIAPSITLAARLLLDPIPRDAAGRALINWSIVWDRAMPPAVVAVAVFLAVEVATAGMRRGIVLGAAGAGVSAAIVGGTAWWLLITLGVSLPTPI